MIFYQEASDQLVKPQPIRLETKFGRILPLTYCTKYDRT